MLTPAKVNLYLEVTGSRADGMHELDTLFFPLPGISDQIMLDFSPVQESVSLSCNAPEVPLEPAKNLCGRALFAYCKAAALAVPDLHIAIEKNIPVTAGMGGGSSDAACVLRQLQARFHALSDADLHAVALSLGADVPYFLNPVPALASGVGECLTPLPEVSRSPVLVIAAPLFPVSAAWAYTHLRHDILRRDTRTSASAVKALQSADWSALAHAMRNDLEYALLDKFPVLTLIRQTLLSSGALAVMVSGSGPTQFALYADNAARVKAMDYLRSHLDPSVRVY